jgi:hypothetical protein
MKDFKVRKRIVLFRVNEHEYQELLTRADNKGMKSVSEYIRAMALGIPAIPARKAVTANGHGAAAHALRS